jgi:hypothetical protein
MKDGSGSGEGPGTTTPHSPGPAFVPPRPEDLAPLFPQLEILELLGHGGMGVVYKARQVRLDRLVALKILPPELGRDPAFAERFAREARALAKLTHPRIVGVHDFGESGGLFYLLMEFVDGVNLRGLLRRGRLTPEEALRIVPQVCEALQYAHEEGVVHRDIKPENILLDRRGNVKIADFGLAKLLGMITPDSALTGSRQVIGTLRYMAPEQMERPLAVDHRADIYSLGVVFYEMLTGELPMGRFDPPSKKVAVDVRLDEVVLRALEKEPERRYQHVSEVKTEVESISSPPVHSGTGSGISPDGAGGHPAAKRQEAWLLLPIFCAAIIASLVTKLVTSPPAPRELLPLVPFIIVPAAGVGLWGLWRFVRGDRAGGIVRPDRAESHPARLAGMRRQVGSLIPVVAGIWRRAGSLIPVVAGIWRQAWPLIPLLCAAYVVDALSWPLMPATIVLAALVELGTSWLLLQGGRAGGIINLDGARTHHLGAAGIWRQAWPLIPLSCAAYIVYALFGNERTPHTIVLAAGLGLWASWQFLRGGRAGDIIRFDGAESHHLGAAGAWRQTWLLIPLLCVADSVYVLSQNVYLPPWLDRIPLVAGVGRIVLEAGVGPWALWQFSRGRDLISLDGARTHRLGAAEIWRPAWLLVPILCAAFVVEAVIFYRMPGAGPLYETPGPIVLAAGVGLWALWQFVRGGRVRDINDHDGAESHHLGAAGIRRQAWLLIPIVCAAVIVHTGTLYRTPDAGPLYQTPGPLVLALGLALWALWQFVRGGRAGDVKTALPEIHPAKPDPARELDSF